MTASLADIRRFITDSFNDEELTSFCFDHFHEVYRNFAADATTGRKALQLVDYCQRRDKLPELIAALRKERPLPFERALGRQGSAIDRRVNINTAGADELRQLPGIGPVLADAIVAGRPYTAVDELLRVPGIGHRRLTAVRGWCVI